MRFFSAFIRGYQRVVEVYIDILPGQLFLQLFNIYAVNGRAVVQRYRTGVAGGLTGENGRRYYAQHVPAVTACACRFARRYYVVEPALYKTAVTHFVKIVVSVKVVYGANAVVEMYVCVLFRKSRVSVETPGGAQLRNRRQHGYVKRAGL